MAQALLSSPQEIAERAASVLARSPTRSRTAMGTDGVKEQRDWEAEVG